MQNFGISQNQPIQSNYPVGPKKKDDKQEKIQKAITYTIGTLAGVGFAALMGYTMVHKGSVKKVVGGVGKNAQKVAEKSKTISPADKTNRNIVFKTLAKINNGEQVTLKELLETQNVLTGVAKEASLKSVLLVLTKIINRYEGKKPGENITIDNSFKAELKPLETEVQNSLIKIFATSDFQNYQNEINFKFNNINLDKLPKIENTQTNKDINANVSDITLQDLVLIDEEHGIYVKNDYNQNKMNDDTDLYIKDTKDKIYTFKASNLKEIVDIPEIDNIINSASIETIDIDKFEIKQCCQTGSSDNAYYVFGFKENASELKYIKVSDLSADNINLLADSQDKLKEVINCSAINLQTVSEVLTKGDKYCNAGTLQDAGNTIMSSICGKIKTADDTHKANIIEQTLSKITNYDNDSLGKAVVKYFVDNAGIDKPEILGKVLEANKDKLCPGGNLNDSGMLIMEAIKEKIEKAQVESGKTINDVKAQIIVDFLEDIKDFGDNSLGKAALKYLVSNDYLNVKIFENVLKAQGKLFESKADGKLNTTSKEILSKILGKDPDYDSLNTLVSDLSLTEYENEPLGIKFDSGTLKVIQSKQAFNLAQSNSEDSIALRALSSTLKKPNDSEIFENPKKLKSELDYNNIKNQFNDLGINYTNYTPTETVLYNVDANNDAKYVQSIKDLPVFIKIININGKDTLVKTGSSNTLTSTGTALVEAIKTNIKDANDIATMLNGIEESKFASGEIGQFVVDAIVKEADATTLGKVLNDSSLMSKLVNTSKTSNELTSTGKALIEAIKTNIKDANDIATMLNELDDDKFKSGKIGQFVVDAIVKEANSDTLSNVLNNDTLKGKLINSTTKDEEKLNLLGQILLKGYANQTLSTTHTNISYSRPEGRAERNRIGTGITINGVRFKFYDKDNEIKYYVGQTK